MRDLETIALALTAAETGPLVFATLHSQGCGHRLWIGSFAPLRQSLAELVRSRTITMEDAVSKANSPETLRGHDIIKKARQGKRFL
jgi:Tfp pilus assembly ATPase PilU